MKIRLTFLAGKDAGSHRDLQLLDGSPLVLGRSDACDLPIWDESASRRHALLELSGTEVVVQDLGSANGLFVNGQQVRKLALTSGDRVRIGETELRLETRSFTQRETAVLVPQTSSAATEVDGSFTVKSAITRDDVRLGEHLAADAKKSARLDHILTFVDEVQNADSAPAIIRLLLERTTATVAAARTSLVPCPPGGGEPAWTKVVGEESDGCSGFSASEGLSRSIVERVLSTGEALIVLDTSRDPRTRDRASIVEHGVKSLVAVPVCARERIHGVAVASNDGVEPFHEEDLAYMATLGQIAGLALENTERLQRSRRALAARTRQDEDQIITGDPDFQNTLELVARFSQSGGPVLLLGETGTGKELLALRAHERGPYSTGAFVALNCAAIPAGLLESELFGHERGAFTGATEAKEGMLELAHRGTLFLDEIGDLPIDLQPKLLRSLERGEFYRVGGRRPVRVELLVVAATHRNLEERIAEGSFREDLFFRLGRFRIPVAPLRERRVDIQLLAETFLARACQRYGRATGEQGQTRFSAASIRALEDYTWPGNVRELMNVVERARVIAGGDDEITPEHLALPTDFGGNPGGSRRAVEPTEEAVATSLAEAEEATIRQALRQTRGRKGEAAEILGIAWPTLRRKLRKYQIDPQEP